jgi:hypothetical protein
MQLLDPVAWVPGPVHAPLDKQLEALPGPRNGFVRFLYRGDLNVTEVAGLNPDGTAVIARGGAQSPTRRKPQPGLRREALAAFVKCAIKDQEFAAVRQIECNRCVRLPALHPHFLAAVVEQRCDFDTGPAWRMRINQRSGVAAHWRAVLQIELPQLDEEHAARCRARWWREVGGLRT